MLIQFQNLYWCSKQDAKLQPESKCKEVEYKLIEMYSYNFNFNKKKLYLQYRDQLSILTSCLLAYY